MTGTQGLIAEAFSASVNPPANAAKFPDDYSQKPHHVKAGRGGFQNPWDRCALSRTTAARLCQREGTELMDVE
jgi:hypothetical protein